MLQEPIPLRCGLTQLTAIRHGQSTANVLFAEAAENGSAEVPLEGCDAQVPLSELGRLQARAAGRWFASLEPGDRPDLVISSPYLRALQTWDGMAAQAREQGCTPPSVLVDERLRDREMGVFELLTPAAIRTRAPEEAARRERVGEWFYRPPGGESLADVTLRIRDFLTEIGDSALGRRVALVAHDAVVVALRHALAGLGSPAPEAAPVANASVTRWEGDGTHLHLAEFGTTTHLKEPTRP
ncbi:histidine phosphatase family protein [Streptomyces griseocarneus]|uniref:histidine phosphatase family protein n=1 Tax=Streptomyces griseocarneus TaxID=51201 RepID=UPI00167C4F6C|nr:histidine phosphatase family protein [Streptomyces griseocarneus]MBZ6475865.1 histidine phosphatase family protein [Streptomyces griseocarneus]GHG50322.1 phosphoglycerate mutase [Streptomyces griseocarneus]